MKRIIIVILFIIISCNNDDNNVDGFPSDFEVLINSNLVNNASISWSESFDPEGLQIRYAVYLNNVLLANNLTVRNYNFSDLQPLEEYNGKVIAFDPEGNETVKTFILIIDENLPPSTFNLISSDSTNVSVNVNWELSEDPEGEEIYYNIFIDNQLIIDNYNLTYFNFENLIAATTYSVKIIAFDPEGNFTSLEFEITTNDGVFQGDVSLSSQNSINNFGALGYIEINGNLEITAYPGVNCDINNLAPLSSIKIVREYFHINFMDNLINLSGLEIEFVGKSFRINSNNSLQTLDGLEDLTEVLGGFEIKQNSNLVSVSNINNLITVGSVLTIYNNINLIDVSGFNGLSTVKYILINANWSLESVSAFNTLTEINGDLSIENNPVLAHITGFDNLNYVKRFYIKNLLITNIDAFSNLIYVDTLNIHNNSLLENIEGLLSLTDVLYGSLSISGNSSIMSLHGLENLNHVGSYINISGNDNLSDFCSLQNVMQTYVTPQAYEGINNNAYNPTFNDILNGNCSL